MGLMDPDVILLVDEDTSNDFGCPPSERGVSDLLENGVVCVDKPTGPTSHQVTAWVKDILKASKTGHSGTLDPKVTGVLPIGFGDALKVVGVLLTSKKEYVGVMKLHGEVSDKRLKDVFREFTGKIYQKPPLKSAVKRELRTRRVFELEVLGREDRVVLFSVLCEAGTYIRLICHDIGLVLGCGAHMAELRRTRSGPYGEEDCVILQDLKDALEFYGGDGDESWVRGIIKPVESAVSDLGGVWLRDSAVDSVCHGASLKIPGICRISKGVSSGELVALYTLKGELVAVAKTLLSANEIASAKKGVAAELIRVVMKPGTYPRMWSASQTLLKGEE